MSFLENSVAVLTAPQIEEIVVEAYKRGRQEAIIEQQKKKGSIDWDSIPNILSIPQAAKLCNEHPTTIKRKCDDDIIDHTFTKTKNRLKVKISKEAIRKYIENKK